ncbi:hypothetical protein TBLA_0E00530 [Henningerozyma blattae CBS 6284]|uniref:Uncharacterized protein n=1 Tax=Henningerozyma blattae (strain ATCC 34711 / CBS 6284 / DSM 70876 / NBRC 10599 / NRRL Y-10934 / UCD 77-7) TaxID=1071380 RepID=I2H412_HENB6|nr:hypothetical protein TBLA_0E00530 [Tetrapisispora blattae CBS 6284]CCH61114.1 hypothetical protein TBLA_0E00530 [Tetrapisispora blattae CBS 6284]
MAVVSHSNENHIINTSTAKSQPKTNTGTKSLSKVGSRDQVKSLNQNQSLSRKPLGTILEAGPNTTVKLANYPLMNTAIMGQKEKDQNINSSVSYNNDSTMFSLCRDSSSLTTLDNTSTQDFISFIKRAKTPVLLTDDENGGSDKENKNEDIDNSDVDKDNHSHGNQSDNDMDLETNTVINSDLKDIENIPVSTTDNLSSSPISITSTNTHPDILTINDDIETNLPSDNNIDTKSTKDLRRPIGVIGKLLPVRRDVSELTYRPIIRKRRIYNDSISSEDSNKKSKIDKQILDHSPSDANISFDTNDFEKGTQKSSLTETQQDWKDLDTPEINDTCMVVEYSNDIFEYLYKRELETIPKNNYTTDTNSSFFIKPTMRAILVDWLVEVHEKFNCYTETLFLAINLMDRFLSSNKVTLNKLQLLAVTSLFIAAKFEEINLPKLEEYSYITDGAATEKDIKDAEMYMLTSLKFELAWPNPINFLRRISKADEYDYQTRNFAKFILEYSICTNLFIGLKPSYLAAMAMFISRRITDRNNIVWDNTFKHYSGGIDPLNNPTFVKNCKLLIKDIAFPSTKLESLILKFKSKALGNIYPDIFHWCKDQVETNYENLLNP